MSRGTLIQEIDTLDVVKNIGKESKKFQAVFLQELEDKLDPDVFARVRKFFLDESSNFTRAVVREVFGDIDYLIQ